MCFNINDGLLPRSLIISYIHVTMKALIVVAAVVLLGCASALQQPAATNQFPTRRSILSLPPKAVIAAATGASSATIISTGPSTANAAKPNGLILDKSSESGLKWADAKQGTGQPLKPGMVASIDYSMASTVGRQPQIYTTKDKGVPYRWTLGDGSTIAVSHSHCILVYSLYRFFDHQYTCSHNRSSGYWIGNIGQ